MANHRPGGPVFLVLMASGMVLVHRQQRCLTLRIPESLSESRMVQKWRASFRVKLVGRPPVLLWCCVVDDDRL